MTTLRLSNDYREAIWVSIVLQVPLTAFFLLILDGGTLAKVAGAAMAGFWIGAGIIMLRRPNSPSKLDLLYIRWGYVPMFIVGICLSPMMGALR